MHLEKKFSSACAYLVNYCVLQTVTDSYVFIVNKEVGLGIISPFDSGCNLYAFCKQICYKIPADFVINVLDVHFDL